MNAAILITETPENFYEKIKECVQQVVQQELQLFNQNEKDVYLKMDEVCKLLKVSKPTVENHAKKGFYKKYYVGSRVFFCKTEIASFLKQNQRKFYSSTSIIS